MKSKWRDTAGKIESFIENGTFKRSLERDQKKCRILGESDLQSCVNRRLQDYLKKEKATEDWYILNEHLLRKVRSRKSKSKKKKKKMKKKSYRPDIVIAFKRKDGTVHPKHIIELKEFKNPTTSSKITTGIKHDLDKMVGYFKKSKKENKSQRNRLRKGYSIWCVSEPHRSFDPKEVQKSMEAHIRARIKKRNMPIEPIVINAFYNNKKRGYKIKGSSDNFNQHLKNKQKVSDPRIKLIHKLKKLQL